MPPRSKRSKAQTENWRYHPTPFFKHSPTYKKARSRLSTNEPEIEIDAFATSDQASPPLVQPLSPVDRLIDDLPSKTSVEKPKPQISFMIASPKTRMRRLQALGFLGIFERNVAQFHILTASKHYVRLQIDTRDLICISTIERNPLPSQYQLTIKNGTEDIRKYIEELSVLHLCRGIRTSSAVLKSKNILPSHEGVKILRGGQVFNLGFVDTQTSYELLW